MKKILFVLAILLSMAMIPRAYAYNFQSGGIYYDITSPNTVAVTYATGSYNSYSGTVDIPSTVTYNGTTYTVTAIGNSAFRSCSNLTGVTIPGTVTSIGDYAFYQCGNLHVVDFPNALTSIGTYAFSTTGLFSITIPASVTSIGSFAFSACNSLTSATYNATNCTSAPSIFYNCSHLSLLIIGNNVNNLPSDVFASLSSLRSVTIPNSVTSMGSNPFSNCSNLDTIVVAGGNAVFSSGNNSSYIVNNNTHTLVTGCKRTDIPNSVTVIGENAFRGCTGLTGPLTIANQITVIGAYAYTGCTGLTSLTIGYAVDSIGNKAFSNCSGISSVAFNADSCRYMGAASSNVVFSGCGNISTLTIGNNVKAIPTDAFYGCNHLTGMLLIPNSVKTIGNSAFYGCNGFTSLSIGNSVTSIGNSAFYNCSNMGGTLTIPSSVISVSNAFSGCTSFTSIIFNADSCTYGSFSGCSNVTSLIIGDNVKIIPANAFENLNHISGELIIQNAVISVGQFAFRGCNNITSIIIGTSVRTIGRDAFSNCTGLSSIVFNADSCISMGIVLWNNYCGVFNGCDHPATLTIGDNVKTIPNNAFQHYSGISGLVNIPNSVVNIGSNAFDGCTGLSSLVIGNSVSSIGNSAFQDCTGLSSLVIGNSVSSIGNSAFQDCTGLSSLVIGNSVTSIGSSAFSGCNSMGGALTIPNSVKTIGNQAFSGCNSIDSLSIGRSVVYIDNYAFQNCTNLSCVSYNADSCISMGTNGSYNHPVFSGCTHPATLTIGDNVKTIPAGAFSNFTGLSSIAFNADSCISMSNYPTAVFSGCTNVTTLTIGENVKTIPSQSFRNLNSLIGALIIPNTVKNIGVSAFSGCSGLTSLTIGNSVAQIGDYAFQGCNNLSGTLTIPNDVLTIGANAFEECGFDTLIIGNAVSTIDREAFKNCTALSYVAFNADSCIAMNYSNYYYEDNYTVFNGCTHPATLIIGENVKIIPKYAFCGLNILGPVSIPNSVTSIGESAFQECENLDSLTIGKSVATIGKAAFKNCNGLSYVEFNADSCGIENDYYMIYPFSGCTAPATLIIGENVKYIHSNFFEGFTGLRGTVVIPDSVKTIGDRAFRDCTGLDSVVIGRSVTSMYSAFGGCTGLTYVAFNADSCENVWVNSFNGLSNISTITIGDNVKIIPNGLFGGCSGITGRITIPNSVVIIGEGAFSNCSGIDSLIIGKSVVSIMNQAFLNCNGLSYVEFNADSCKSSGIYSVFGGCTNSARLLIGSNVKNIPNNIFDGFTGLQGTLIIPDSVVSIGERAFYGCSGLDSLIIGRAVSSIYYANVYYANNGNNSAFKGCSGLTYVEFNADSCAAMGNSSNNYVFSDCNNINKVVIGNNVKSIPDYAFCGRSQLTGALVIPNSVNYIGNYAFYVCSSLTGTLSIPNNVVSIGDRTFYGCSGLDSLIIGKSVSSIYYANNSNNSAFKGCSGLTYVEFNADSCAAMGNSGNNYVFSGCNNINEVVIGNNVKSIPDYAFYGLNQITGTLIVPDSVTTIGNSAFSNCSMINKLVLGESVSDIGRDAFSGCTSLSGRLTIPNKVDHIRASSFKNCSGLDTLYIGKAVASIDTSAFDNCSDLKYIDYNAENCAFVYHAWYHPFYYCSKINTVVFGNSVKSIPNDAFYQFYTKNVLSGSLIIPDSVTSIGKNAFQGCSSLTSLTLGRAVSVLDSAAFGSCSGLEVIISYAATPPSIVKTYNNDYGFTFNNVNRNIPVYVPCGSMSSYQTEWKKWSSSSYFYNIYETFIPYLLIISSEDTLKGTVQITTEPTCTSPAVIKATPNYYYTFDHWSDGNTENPRTIEPTQDTMLVAYFREITLTVLQPSDTAMGQVVILQAPTKENPQAIVQVVSGNCYTFSDWRSPYNNWETISLSNPFTFTLTQDTVIRAYFNSETQISISSSTNNSICEGDSIVVTASGGESYIWTKTYWDDTQGRYFDQDTVGFDESVVLTETGSYRVKGTDTTGCYSWSNAFNVSTLPSPSLTINGLTDICEGENTVISVVAQIESTSGLYEDFSNGIPSNWTVSNNFLTTYTIASDNSHGRAIKFPCYELYNGEVDELILPDLDLGELSDPMLKFDVAYRRYNYQTSDQLRVLCSTNNGSSWIELYSKAGNVLSTLGVSNQNFIPADNQWRTDSIDLSDYIGVANMKIKFEFTSDYGNNIWIDNIRVYSDGYVPSFLYEWSDGSTESQQTFDTSGTWQVIVTAENGCHTSESVSINLWQPADTTEITINSPDCNYAMNGETFYLSGDYTQTLQTTHGCDSVVYLHLILTLDTTVVNDTVYGSYYYYGDDDTEVSISGYKYSYQYQMSPEQYPQWADSILAYQATHSNQIQYALSYDSSSNMASKSYIKIDDYRMLQGYAYYSKILYPEYSVWKDSAYYDISDTLLAWSFYSSCDSTVIWNTRIMFGDRQYVYLDECGQYIWQGDSIFRSGTSASGTMVLGFASGDILTESGMYYQQLTNVNGCDSSVYRYLTIHPAAYEELVETACESYTLNGITYTESGIYTQFSDTTLVVNRNLFWKSYYNCGYWNSLGLFTSYKPTGWSDRYTHYNYDDQWNVIGVDYYFLDANGDTTYLDSANQVVVYADTVDACKEWTLYLTINNSVTESIDITACDSYSWNDSVYTQSGDYTQTFTAANGCDSVVTLHLTINNSNATEFSVVACESYTWNDSVYVLSGDYTQAFETVHGCDSLVTLHLTVNSSDLTELTAAACGQYVWLDSTYTESGNYSVTYTNVEGCDSVVTLHLTINPIPDVAITGSTTICPGGGTMLTATGADTYMWSNYSTNASIPVNMFGVYSVTGTTLAGCYNIATVTVLVAQPPVITVSGDLELCAGETGTITAHGGTTYMWSNGSTDSTLAVSGAGTWQVIGYDENGCNGMASATVTVWQPVTMQFTVTVNDSCYVWNTVSYCESGDYTQSFQSVHGCDSVVTLHLILTNTVYEDIYETACDSYTWNNATYSQSGDYVQTFTLADGSDSVVTLHLTLSFTDHTDMYVSECESYTWNGVIYTESGDYTLTFTNSNGCDSVVTLHLTINNPVHTALTAAACGSYEWNGTTYTVSGDYTYSHLDVNGCTQVDTLHLTINNSTTGDTTAAACNSFTWQGETYSQSGDYTSYMSNANGCDSVVTLHLSIYQDETSEFSIVTDDPCYTWNSVEYCESGDYTQTLQTIHGCDSIVTLHLTITVGIDDHETADFKVFPNPTNSVVNVECTMNNVQLGEAEIQVVDMYGKLVRIVETHGRASLQGTIDISDLANGVYFVKLVAENKTIAVRKVVKQ